MERVSWVCDICKTIFQLKPTLDFHLFTQHAIEQSSEKKYKTFTKNELGLEAIKLLQGFEIDTCSKTRYCLYRAIQEVKQKQNLEKQSQKTY